MSGIYEKLHKCVDKIRSITDFEPKAALVLGSGLGDFAESGTFESVARIPYSQIEGFPVSTVPGHSGEYIFGYVCGVPVVCMKGRVHYYEGYPMEDVVLPVRVMGMLGAGVLILTNASGGINVSFEGGDLMLITDQISTFVPSPLIGKNADEIGTRFPDMSSIYDGQLCDMIRSAAQEAGILIREGVYAQVGGPNFETPAEVRMLRILGADAVGMSTGVEAVAAHHMGMRVCGISCVTNKAAGMSKKPLSHDEVQQKGREISERFTKLITEVIRNIGRCI